MANSGIVKTVSGTVRAVATDGSERFLHVGDSVLPNEQVITGATGTITIESSDGNIIDLGFNSEITFNSELITPESNAESEVKALQQAILENKLDPSELEAPAAGRPAATGDNNGALGDDGHTAVHVFYELPTRTPDSGFETKGIFNQFSELEEEFILNPDTGTGAVAGADQETETLPTLSINDVTIQEPPGGFFNNSDSYNIAYIIDVSRSMNIGTRLADTQQAISSLNQSIVDLGIADKTEIAVIPFHHRIPGGDRAPTFFTTADPDTNNNSINDIKEFIDGLQPSGGTNFTPPLEVAADWLNDQARHEDSQNIIFFISDGRGRFNPLDPDIQALYNPAEINAKIISIGIGPTASADQLDLVDDLNGNNNSSIQVPNTADLGAVLSNLIQQGGGGGGGSTGLAIAEFTVSLSAVTDQAVTVSFTTVDGTAISGGTGVNENDYSLKSGTVTIPAGSTSATIEITIFSDHIPEDPEQFLVLLDNPVNATIADGTGVGTIIDNPPIEENDNPTVGVTFTQLANIEQQVNSPLIGDKENDILEGQAGNDILIGGSGNDILTGGAGADIFNWNEGDADGSIDTIVDFNTSEGDIIKLSDILDYNSGNDDISKFLNISEVEDNAVISIDTDGSGGYTDGSIVLKGISIADIDVGQMISNGELVVE
jgi:Ca2+-binding RTX toxin-like protein